VRWCLWVYVIKCHNIFVTKNYVRRNITVDDFAKQTVGI